MKKKQFIIASHGKFAQGLYDSLSLIMGEQKNVETLCAYIDDNNIEEQIKDLLQKYQEEDLIVLTDLYGGSVNNLFMKFIKMDNFFLVSGINLPMLIEMICSQYLSSEQMIQQTLSHLCKGIQYCNHLDVNEEMDDF